MKDGSRLAVFRSGIGRHGPSHPLPLRSGPRAPRSPRLGCLAIAIAILIFAVAAGLSFTPARARGDESSSHESSGPTAAQTAALLESGKAPPLVEGAEADLHAAQTMPHRELQRSEALELAEAVFEPEIDSAAGIYHELEPEKYLSEHAAIVPVSSLPEAADQSEKSLPIEHPNKPVLVESMLPLRTENSASEEEPVDLELEHSEGELQPQNPLAEVGIPQRLGEGISLAGPEVDITLSGAPAGRVATDASGQFAFYPEVAEDSDLIVAPTPRGVETMVDLRSAEAPTHTTYQLTLPATAELRADREGGAEVVEGGRTTVLIPSPTAVDAAGDPVQTELTVSEDELTVRVDPNPSTAFPVLVDPEMIYESWHWIYYGERFDGWYSTTSNATVIQPYQNQVWGSYYPGLDLSAGVGGWTSNGAEAHWHWWVPRYAEDMARFGSPPSTWVYQMYTEGVFFMPYGNTENYPALILGLVDPNFGWQVDGVHYGYQGEMNNWGNQFWFTNEYDQHGDKGADMELFTPEAEYPAKRRDAYLASALIYIVDEEAPRILELNPPGKWVSGSWASIPYTFEDPGLGVEGVRIGLAGESPLRWPEGFNCNGTNRYPCPRVVNSGEAGRPALAFVPSELPTGKDTLEVAVSDTLGVIGAASNTAHGYVVVKVDHTAPAVSLSGPLTEQGSLGTHRPAYALRINARDGVEGAPQSGVKKVEIKVDGNPVPLPEPSEWEPNCQTQNCPFSGEWTMNASEYGAGPHEVQVIATDAAGNASPPQTLHVELNPPAPTLSLSGTLTEQAMLGTERPSYNLHINASAMAESPTPAALPTYSSAFGSSGSGTGQLTRPGSMAVDAQGNLWVVDSNDNRVEKFNEKGEYVSQFGTKGTAAGQLSRPTAIAAAANGNLWVTDSGNKRVEEFTPAGAYVAKFGSAGTGNGQFAGSGPEAIAIDYHGNIWVADTYGGRLEKFNEGGGFVRSVATKGKGPQQLGQPDGVAIGPGGNVFVTDWEDDKVAEYGEGGKFIRQFGSEGSEPGQLKNPTGIAIDSRGDVWVPDQNNGRVEEFNQGGEYLGRFGAKGTGAGQFELSYPTGIATDTKGDIWVTDAGDNRVEKWVAAGYVPGGATFLRSFGTEGTGNGQFRWPIGVATDGKGNVWVSDFLNDRVERFNESGAYLGQFGSAGAGNGQFVYPFGVAVDPKGHVWVADDENDRVQEFGETGTFIRSFGTLGTGAGQLHDPLGIAVDSKNDVWVTDAANYRVDEFGETGTYIRSFGSQGSGPGQFGGELRGLAVTPAGNVWVADGGANRIEEFTETGGFIRQVRGEGSGSASFQAPNDIAIDAAGNLWVTSYTNGRVVELSPQGEPVSQFGSAGTGAGQFQHPVSIALDGKGHAFVTDQTAEKVDEWTLPVSHSQISTEITVDGKRVDAAETSCATETCAANTEWTLQSSSFTPGSHTVVVRATDGLGNATSKTLNVKVGDTTKPGLEVGGELMAAPEGWIEQAEGNYGLNASATDSGYGVTSLVFSLDGHAVATKTQSCPAGACTASISTTVNAHGLSAGAHPAEVVATDGAGNTTAKRWTLNVDPEGKISIEEAEATIEAMEETTPPVSEVESILETSEILESETPGIATGEQGHLRVTNGNVPVELSTDPSEGATYEIADQRSLSKPCMGEVFEPAHSAEEGSEGEVIPPTGACTGYSPAERARIEEEERVEEEEVAAGLKTVGREPITITPLATSGDSGELTSIDGSAALAPNTHSEADTVFRPMSDGGFNFEEIRSSAAPEHYAFELGISTEQELILVDPRHVEVKYDEGGPVAFTITALPAHDAIGTTVPTQLTVTAPNILTLTVEHRAPSPAGGNFVYPVIGGTGWEGGYRTISVELTEPPPPSESGEGEWEIEQLEGGKAIMAALTVGPPEETEPMSRAEESEMLSASQLKVAEANPGDPYVKLRKKFSFNVCRPRYGQDTPLPIEGPREERKAAAIQKLHFHCFDPEYGGYFWRETVSGRYHMVFHEKVWLNWKEWNCEEDGEKSEEPHLEHCEARFPNGVHYPSGERFKGPIDPMAQWRFGIEQGHWPAEDAVQCMQMGGKLFPNPRQNTQPLEEPMIYERPNKVQAGEPCHEFAPPPE